MPDISIHGNLSSVHCSLDLYKYKLIRGLLENNLGEPIEEFMRPYDLQDPRIHVSGTFGSPLRLVVSADGIPVYLFPPVTCTRRWNNKQSRFHDIYPLFRLVSTLTWSVFSFSRLFWAEKCTRACVSSLIWWMSVWSWKIQREGKVLGPWPGRLSLHCLAVSNGDTHRTYILCERREEAAGRWFTAKGVRSAEDFLVGLHGAFSEFKFITPSVRKAEVLLK